MTKTLDYYRRLPYKRVWQYDEGQWIVRIAEFPRIVGCAPTKSDALEDLRSTFDDMVSWALEDGVELPEPTLPLAYGQPSVVVEISPAPMVQVSEAVKYKFDSEPESRSDVYGEEIGRVYQFNALDDEPECAVAL